MNIFLIILSILSTAIFIVFNKDIILTFNFSLILIFFISFMNFINLLFNFFEKIDVIVNNKLLRTKIKEILIKNRELIHLYNSLRKEYFILTLKNAHLSLLTASLTKNKEVFDTTIKNLGEIGVTEEILNKYENLINLINLIESNKVEIIFEEGKNGNSIKFKDKSS